MQDPLYYLLLGFVVGAALGLTAGTYLTAKAAMRDLTKLTTATEMLLQLASALVEATRPLKPPPQTDPPSLRQPPR